ncbi:MAG TPA: hypothetical protein VGG60_01905 [Candidatus Binataceae bacterium]
MDGGGLRPFPERMSAAPRSCKLMRMFTPVRTALTTLGTPAVGRDSPSRRMPPIRPIATLAPTAHQSIATLTPIVPATVEALAIDAHSAIAGVALDAHATVATLTPTALALIAMFVPTAGRTVATLAPTGRGA